MSELRICYSSRFKICYRNVMDTPYDAAPIFFKRFSFLSNDPSRTSDRENNSHQTEKQYINEQLRHLSDRTLQAHQLAWEAYEQQDAEMMNEIHSVLRNFNHEANELDNKILELLGEQDIDPVELRSLVSNLKIINELVRVCNNAKSYAKNMQTFFSEGLDLSFVQNYVMQIHKSSLAALSLATDVLKNTDHIEGFENLEKVYVQTKIEESKTDDLYKVLENDLLERIKENKEFSTKFVKFLSTIRKLERTADHAVNITSLILYVRRDGKIKSY